MLRLVAEGLSNSEIAACLTVRACAPRPAVVTAYESGLVVPARSR